MSVPIPISKQVPISAFDCIRRGSATTNLELDDQRFDQVGGIAQNMNDAKLLYLESEVPLRSIKVEAFKTGVGSAPGLSDIAASITNDVWSKIAWGGLWVQDIFNPYKFADGGLANGDLLVNAISPPFPVSYWMWGSISGHVLVTDPFQTLQMVVSQVICPDAFSEVNYEIWTCTFRNDPGHDSGDIPSDAASWSLSSDFTRESTGTLKPGEILTIKPPLDKEPQAPPAPTSKEAPYDIFYWTGWGVCRYVIFPDLILS